MSFTSYGVAATSGMIAPAFTHRSTTAISASEIFGNFGGIDIGSFAGPSWRINCTNKLFAGSPGTSTVPSCPPFSIPARV